MQNSWQGTTGNGSIDPDDTYGRVVRKYQRVAHQDRLDGLVSKDVPFEMHIVHIYLVEKANLSAATRKVYRNALSRHFLDQGTVHARQALAILNGSAPHDPAFFILLKGRHVTPPRLNNRLARKRGQPCPSSHLAGFLRVLAAARSKWAPVAVDFYLAGVFTGLRPGAWRSARRVDVAGIPALVLPKTGTGPSPRSSVPKLLILRDLTPIQVALVDRHLARLHEQGTNDQFGCLFEGCRQLVRDVAQRSVPAAYAIPSLDSARDLFGMPTGLALGQDHALCTLGDGSAAEVQCPPDDESGGDVVAPAG